MGPISQIGHALHDLDPVLKRYSYDQRVGQVSPPFWQAPPVLESCQSIYLYSGTVGTRLSLQLERPSTCARYERNTYFLIVESARNTRSAFPGACAYAALSSCSCTRASLFLYLVAPSAGSSGPRTLQPSGGAVHVHLQAAADWWRGEATPGRRISLHGGAKRQFSDPVP